MRASSRAAEGVTVEMPFPGLLRWCVLVEEDELRAALADFDGLWKSLSLRERIRVLELVVERVSYDGVAGTVSITFRGRTNEEHEDAA